MLHLVTYDIVEPDLNRAAVEKAIEALGVFRKVLTTTYFVVSNQSDKAIREAIAKVLKEDDSIVVSECSGGLSCDLEDEHIRWLNNHK